MFQTVAESTVALSTSVYYVPSPVAPASLEVDEFLGPQVLPYVAAPIPSGMSTVHSSAVSRVPIFAPSASWLAETVLLLVDGPFLNVVSS